MYDRQIRLWGLEAQNRYVPCLALIPETFICSSTLIQTAKVDWQGKACRKRGMEDDENEQRRIRLIPRMRSSTVLILSLKTVAHEIIKNLVLAGIGRLIVMDNGTVTEEDLGSGFLFREEEGAVGQEVGLLSFSVFKSVSLYLSFFPARTRALSAKVR